jgi:GDP-L-fucose synthase
VSGPLARDAKVYVAGHRGLVGSAVLRHLQAKGFTNLLTRTRAELDLRDPHAVDAFFAAERPQYVILAAAKVGGILANATNPADFIHQNLMIAANVIDAAHRFEVSKLLNLGSSCIYPKHAPQPLREDALLTGPLESTNRAYAIAKIAAIGTPRSTSPATAASSAAPSSGTCRRRASRT